ncbi:AraC family transcriptional regulator [Xanthomonas campestris]|uniref:AraC family transcriptional regulator n=1 Tax=Xanthomonas campestris TaxID=339 RepID=UPI002B23E18F|nr:AraC family transcriptional regulator [Xanthomonas campestris]MEB1028089.1 AraC family transcriptional regulator [Xanthomonas campestris pv. campestris]MEA9553801.1 AraC family transcriptional regulator [Xanthomonas campestris]MEB1101422.1 AraC family transcriptional regulator [Xanthomonas campestris pv. campestris]MEB1136547.1 AraC family transcriptional regulator [Xanthomonas campestris pv. campestris]MEB1146625.1 AraC family transcriptional regulator [Xanthomonas campestris pv. campestri
MLDPLAEVVLLLRPAPGFSKLVLGAGVWSAYRSDAPGPFYCAVIEGKCRLALEGGQAHVLEAGDFVLAPAMMEYLLAWRMALAKTLLSEQGLGVAQAAQRVGYGSASSFSVAFTRHTGSPPSQYARVRTATSLDAV